LEILNFEYELQSIWPSQRLYNLALILRVANSAHITEQIGRCRKMCCSLLTNSQCLSCWGIRVLTP